MHSDKVTGKSKFNEKNRLKEVARIRAKLTLAKLTLSEIDKAYQLPPGTAGNSLHEPHVSGERAIAAALRTKPHLLWFTRYHPDGRRYSPQPAENYRNGRRASQKEAA